MLAQQLRRWPNIKTALFQRAVFAGCGLSNTAIASILYLEPSSQHPGFEL